MQANWTINGVPERLALDGYWLTADAEREGPSAPREGNGSQKARWRGPATALVGLVLLVSLADLLFYDQRAGLSVAIFALATYGLAALLHEADWSRHRSALPVLLLGVLPVAEFLQTASVLVLILCLMTSLLIAHAPREISLPRSVGRFWLRLFYAAPFDLVRASLAAGHALGQTRRADLVRGWALPVTGVLVIGALLLEANPVLSGLVPAFGNLDWPAHRATFWCPAAFVLWPFLVPALAARDKRDAGWTLPEFGANAVSVTRALVAFNLLLSLQTALDAGILVGGAALPEGMTFAEYAHRGAYPLMATALLAGLFALIARPFLDERRGLRWLMALWLGQNVALCASALMRLDLYVEAYGLTLLRVRAAIWMVLVAIGLLLIGWQIARSLSNGWLIRRAMLLVGVTIWLGLFVNFSAIVAHENLTREGEVDWSYVCSLPNTAQAARLSATVGDQQARHMLVNDVYPCRWLDPRIAGWRDWGFRKWRVIRTIAAIEEGATGT